MDYGNGLLKWTAKWATHMDYLKREITCFFSGTGAYCWQVTINVKPQGTRVWEVENWLCRPSGSKGFDTSVLLQGWKFDMTAMALAEVSYQGLGI